MPAEFNLELKFWGVRGSTPTPAAANLGYGGNTTCMEIRSGTGERIIVDAGTGIRELGRTMRGPQDLDLFLTHFHWDHIQGMPFFLPLMSPGNKVRFHSFPSGGEIRERLRRQMEDPYFTLEFEGLSADCEFRQVDNVFRKGDLSVTPFPMNHPQGVSGYRIECGGKSIVIASDLEHGDAKLDRTLRDVCCDADVMIYDAQYTPAEYATRKGWGHSTYVEAAAVAHDAGVKQLVLFHHDPTHTDDQVTEIVKQTRQLFGNSIAAKELTTIVL